MVLNFKSLALLKSQNPSKHVVGKKSGAIYPWVLSLTFTLLSSVCVFR